MPTWSDAAGQDESHHAEPPKNRSTMTACQKLDGLPKARPIAFNVRELKQDHVRDRCEIHLSDGRRMAFGFHLFTAAELRDHFAGRFDIEDLRGLDLFHSRRHAMGDDKKRSGDRRTTKERRSGKDTRSEGEKRLTGERRSKVDRRSGQDRRAKPSDTPKTK